MQRIYSYETFSGLAHGTYRVRIPIYKPIECIFIKKDDAIPPFVEPEYVEYELKTTLTGEKIWVMIERNGD